MSLAPPRSQTAAQRRREPPPPRTRQVVFTQRGAGNERDPCARGVECSLGMGASPPSAGGAAAGAGAAAAGALAAGAFAFGGHANKPPPPKSDHTETVSFFFSFGGSGFFSSFFGLGVPPDFPITSELYLINSNKVEPPPSQFRISIRI